MPLLDLFKPKVQQWDKFFVSAEIHESLRATLKSFVGSWPSGVDPTIFGGEAGKELASNIHAFLSGPYPLEVFKKFGPDYREINGKIARVSNVHLDGFIYTFVPANKISSDQPPAVIWRLIQEYSKSPLPRLLFTFPHIQKLSMAANGEAVALIVKDGEGVLYRNLTTDQILRIQVFKGVENTIFAAYDDLPKRVHLSDKVIDKRFRSLLSRRRNSWRSLKQLRRAFRLV